MAFGPFSTLLPRYLQEDSKCTAPLPQTVIVRALHCCMPWAVVCLAEIDSAKSTYSRPLGPWLCGGGGWKKGDVCWDQLRVQVSSREEAQLRFDNFAKSFFLLKSVWMWMWMGLVKLSATVEKY